LLNLSVLAIEEPVVGRSKNALSMPFGSRAGPCSVRPESDRTAREGDDRSLRSVLPRDELARRIRWFVLLRWVAVMGASATILLAGEVLGIVLPYRPLFLVIFSVCLYNTIFYICDKRVISAGDPATRARRALDFANVQIAMDMTALGFLIHFSGGVSNPFIFYFIFHVVIASMLLSRAATFLQATLAVTIVLGLSILECRGTIPHYSLEIYGGQEPCLNPVFITGVVFVFATTMYLTAFMATSITGELRKKSLLLIDAWDQLSMKDKLKSEYVYRVTHDIKGHLGAIRTCLSPVLAGMTDDVDPRQRDLLERAKEEVRQTDLLRQVSLEIDFRSARRFARPEAAQARGRRRARGRFAERAGRGATDPGGSGVA